MSDEAAVMWYGYNKAVDECTAAIKGITEEELMEATHNTITQQGAVMIRNFLMERIGRK